MYTLEYQNVILYVLYNFMLLDYLNIVLYY